jgi:hypothetical protein
VKAVFGGSSEVLGAATTWTPPRGWELHRAQCLGILGRTTQDCPTWPATMAPMVLEHACGHRLAANVVCEACGEPAEARTVRPTAMT